MSLVYIKLTLVIMNRIFLVVLVFVFVSVCGADEKSGALKLEGLEMPSGVVYEGVTVTEVTPAWIKIMHKNGIKKLMLSVCSEKVQKIYGYDVDKAHDYLLVEKKQRNVDAKRELIRRMAYMKLIREKARKKKERLERERQIRQQKQLVRPMRFYVVQALRGGAALCKVQVLVNRSSVIDVQGPLSVQQKRYNFRVWEWLGSSTQRYYVRGVGDVVDEEFLNGYGITTAEVHRYKTPNYKERTVSVIDLTDKHGVQFEKAIEIIKTRKADLRPAGPAKVTPN